MVGVKEGGKALQTSVLGVKTLHSTAEAPDNTTKASGWELEVAVLGMGVSNPGYVALKSSCQELV